MEYEFDIPPGMTILSTPIAWFEAAALDRLRTSAIQTVEAFSAWLAWLPEPADAMDEIDATVAEMTMLAEARLTRRPRR